MKNENKTDRYPDLLFLKERLERLVDNMNSSTSVIEEKIDQISFFDKEDELIKGLESVSDIPYKASFVNDMQLLVGSLESTYRRISKIELRLNNLI